VNEKRTDGPKWDAESIRSLRRYLEMTQQEMSDELGVRQQTISDWECGYHRPRGGMSRLLTIVAERAGFGYTASPSDQSTETHDPNETPEPTLPAQS
jgi:transcriptional regulator with XRE-family HTH domain